METSKPTLALGQNKIKKSSLWRGLIIHIKQLIIILFLCFVLPLRERTEPAAGRSREHYSCFRVLPRVQR